MNDLYKDKLNNRSWKGYGLKTHIEHGIYITPDWISYNGEKSNKLNDLNRYMVQTKGISARMINTYYDYNENTPFNITIEMTNDKIPEEIFLSLLAHIQRLGLGPKGRGRIVFEEVVRVK